MSEESVEIPAGPEQVWAAITTDSGAWSFQVDVEEDTVHVRREPFAPDATATLTGWEPPGRFAYEDPTFATEYLITARDNGSCVLRVVNSLRVDGEGWDDIAEQAAKGWRMTLEVLRVYATHFAGMPSARIDLMTPVNAPETARAQVGRQMFAELGIEGSACDGPLITGVVEHQGPYFALLRTTEAMFAISAFPMDAVTLSINVTGRVYGPDAEAVAARERPRWQDWLGELVDRIGKD
ncbi:SRPBCC domain-containing protein [Kutzneria sp. NPDC051319]|uniref:SRPBCC family protein n=1 Tax=Kutzneria sp. NPDC051319 TaxID=3155047 RepID=UPI0034145A48